MLKFIAFVKIVKLIFSSNSIDTGEIVHMKTRLFVDFLNQDNFGVVHKEVARLQSRQLHKEQSFS